MNNKRIRIPNEDVLMSELEVEVLQTRIFQRLFSLKQLGLAYLVYPFATHTRGAHSIKCVVEATKILESKKLETEIKKDSEDYKIIRLAALLHDIGHLPYSHTLEDEHAIYDKKHDRPERLSIAIGQLKTEIDSKHHDILDKATDVLKNVSSKDHADKDYMSDVVGNTVCADLLAYIITDAENTGIEKRPGYYRIYDYFVKYDNRLCIQLTKGGLRPDIISAILDLLDMRYALTERVIFHHAKCVASAMLARAVRLCDLKRHGYSDDDLLKLGDEGFLNLLEETAKEKKIEGSERLIRNLRSRRLYQRIFKVGTSTRKAHDGSKSGTFSAKWRKSEEVENLLARVESIYKMPQGSLVLWCPQAKSGMKLVEANVVWEAPHGKLQGPYMLRGSEVEEHFPGVHHRVKVIEEQYLDLWVFWIALDRDWINAFGNAKKVPDVVRTLEENLKVNCEEDFVETYLSKHISDYEIGNTTSRVVGNLFAEKVRPYAIGNILEQAAYDGPEGTNLEPSESEILEAMRDALDGNDEKTDQERDDPHPKFL